MWQIQCFNDSCIDKCFNKYFGLEIFLLNINLQTLFCFDRITTNAEADVPSSSQPARLPIFHARYLVVDS